MATTSPIRGSRRSRGRLFAAALGLCGLTVALFMLVQSPLHAESQARVVVTFDGKKYPVSRAAITEQGTEGVQDIKVYDSDGNETDPVHIDQGMNLKQLLDTAGVPEGLNTVELVRADGSKLYAIRDDTTV